MLNVEHFRQKSQQLQSTEVEMSLARQRTSKEASLAGTK